MPISCRHHLVLTNYVDDNNNIWNMIQLSFFPGIEIIYYGSNFHSIFCRTFKAHSFNKIIHKYKRITISRNPALFPNLFN